MRVVRIWMRLIQMSTCFLRESKIIHIFECLLHSKKNRSWDNLGRADASHPNFRPHPSQFHLEKIQDWTVGNAHRIVCPDALDCCTRQDVCVSLAYTHTHTQMYVSLLHIHTHTRRCMCLSDIYTHTHADVCVSLTYTHTHTQMYVSLLRIHTHARVQTCEHVLASTDTHCTPTHMHRIVWCDLLECCTRRDVSLSHTHTRAHMQTYAHALSS